MSCLADITILSWNRIDDTIKAIESSLAQEGVSRRVIVVDQGSEKDGLDRLKAFCDANPEVRLVCNGKNTGVPGGRNIAANQSDSKYIIALDNDAEFADTHQVAKAIEVMEKDPKIGVLGFRILRYGTTEDDASSWGYPLDIKEWADKEFYSTRFTGAGYLFRRDVFDSIDGYDDSLFFLHEEVEIARRVVNYGYKIKYSPEVVILHKVSPENRVHWNDLRWYYDVRNSLYIYMKFKKPFIKYAYRNFAYMVKAIKHKKVKSTLKGMFDAIKMYFVQRRQFKGKNGINQTAYARRYYNLYES